MYSKTNKMYITSSEESDESSSNDILLSHIYLISIKDPHWNYFFMNYIFGFCIKL